MTERGIESPLWLARQVISMSHPALLRKAVIGIIEHLEEVSSSGTTPYEIIDRLVQVASTGEYKAPPPQEEEVMRKVITLKDGKLTPEDEREIEKFLEQLSGVPEAEQTDDDMPYEEWLKKMGIPDLTEDDDEDDQE